MITINNNREPNLYGILLRLGGFHTLVSYLAAMTGSGLWSFLAFTDAENTVPHILGCKVYGRAVVGHLLGDDDINTIIAAKTPTSRDCWGQGCWSWDNWYRSRWQCLGWGCRLWFILNVHCACAVINEALPRFISVDFKTSDQHKDSSLTEMTSLRLSNSWDSENLFEVNSAKQHSLNAGIVAHKSWNVDMQHSSNNRSLTDHKVWKFVFKKSNYAVEPASKYPVKARSDTVSVNPLLPLQQFIIFGYDSRCA